MKKNRGEMSLRVLAVTVTSVQYLLAQLLIIVVPMFAFVWLRGYQQILDELGSGHLEVADLFIGLIIFSFVVNVVGWLWVSTIPLHRKGATLGMRLFGLAVVRSDGAPLTWGAALAREGILLLLGATGIGLVIAGLMALVDREGLALWDRLSRTEVIRVPARFEYINEARRRAEKD